MRFLLLIFFLSCGRQETPPMQDTFDLDGDGIQNYLEPGDRKFVSDIEGVSLSAVLSFETEKKYEFSLSNEFRFHDVVMKSLFFHHQLPFGFERYRLWLNQKPLEKIQLNKSNLISLYFLKRLSKIKRVHLISYGKTIVSEDYEPNLTFLLSENQLSDLIDGKSYFWLETIERISSFEDTHRLDELKSKTHRFFIKDKTSERLLYVARGISLETFLSAQKIAEVNPFPEIDFFFEKEKSLVRSWWLKKMDEDYYLVYASLDELRSWYLRFFHKNLSSLKVRNNQVLENNLMLNFRFAKLRGVKTEHTLITRTKFESQRQGRGGVDGDRYDVNCQNTYREIEKTETKNLLPSELRSFVDPNLHWVEGEDTEGPYLKISSSPQLKPEFFIQNLQSQEAQMIGPIQSRCQMGEFQFYIKRRPLYPLEELSLTLETYIEPEDDFTLQY